LRIEEWLGLDNQLGMDIWRSKYQYNNESFEDWLQRVSGGNPELKELIRDKKFLFGGRALANRGTDKKGSMFNCYSSGYVPDDIDGIMQINTNLALTYKAQGGQGVSLSKIRPKDTPIGNEFKSDGIVPFMEIFNTTTSSISQGGARKGALMMSLDIMHKEAETFITIKSNEDKITKANLSLEIDDKFMRAVNTYYETGEIVKIHERREYNGHVVEYDVTPINLYKLMMETVYDWGEPGCIYSDRFRNYNLMQYDENYEIQTCNPCGEQPLPKDFSCVSGDTLISLPDRVAKIKELCKEGYNSYVMSNDNVFRKCSGVVERGVKPIYRLTLKNGLSIDATLDHKFETLDGVKELGNIQPNKDKIKVNTGYYLSRYDDNDELYEMFGWMHGDGWITEKAIGISFNKKDGDFDVKDRLLPKFKEYFQCESVKPLKDDDVSYQLQTTGNTKVVGKCKNLGFVFGLANERRLPESFYSWSLNQQYSFLRGLFAADGNIQGKCNGQVWLYSASEMLIADVQKFLASVGIHSSRYCSNFKSNPARNPQYKLSISKNSAKIFSEVIGFNGHKKEDRLNLTNYKDENDYIVESIEYIGEEMTYDILEVDKTNMFFANGISVHNCNLGSLNLYEFIVNPFTEDARFDWHEFAHAVHIAVEGLDDIIDENLHRHALKAQAENSKNYRNIGLGIMGYANALFALGITYGDKEAKLFTKNLFKFFFSNAVAASANIASQKGAFPMCNKEAILKSDILKQIDDIEIIKMVEQYGLRNCSLLSIAPTGSIATMLGISGGCEPEFALSYTRRTDNLNESYKVYCKSVRDYARAKGINVEEIKVLPEYFITSAEIPWKNRIEVQGIMQDYVDTAISSTVNLPKDIPAEDIEELYLCAWKHGLKGVTIFRDGCKKLGILISDSVQEEMQQSDSMKEEVLPRGVVIEAHDDAVGKKRKLITGCGSLHCTAFFDPVTGDLRETYLSKGSAGGCNNFMIGLSRMISLSARGGVHIDDIIDQLNSCGSCPSYAIRSATQKDTSKGSCCPTAVGNALREMWNEMQYEINDCEEFEDLSDVILQAEDEVDETIDYECPKCGDKLYFEGGCNICKSCGWSKCD